MLDAYRDLIDELLGTPSEIRGLVDAVGVTDAPSEAKRLIAELRDRDRVVLERVQTISREENPYLRPLRFESTVTDDALASLLDEFDLARGELVSALINLSLKDWEREAIHATEGNVTVADEVEAHVEFDETHRRRLRELLAPS
jgi:hypothetical protein